MIEIRTVDADIILAPENHWLLVAYANESKIPELPDFNPQMQSYKHMEAAGMLHSFGAFLDGRMIGFVSVLTNIALHYGVKFAIIESIFVDAESRVTGAGLRLIREVFRHAKRQGAAGVFTCAPLASKYDRVLGKSGFKPTNRIFFKRV